MIEELLVKVKEYAMVGGIRIIEALLIIFIGFKLVKLLCNLVKKGKLFARIDKSAKTFILSFVSIALKIVILLTAAAVLGVPMTNIVALLGSAGLAIGLALQGSLSNFAGGIMILIFKPFIIGDYIRFDKYEGTVESISVLYTTLVTFQNQKVIIPNGSISNASVINDSANKVRRLDVVFGIAYSADVEKAREILLSIIGLDEAALKDPAPSVVVIEHGDSAVKLKLLVWCEFKDYYALQARILEESKKLFSINGIEIPFPQVDVHLDPH